MNSSESSSTNKSITNSLLYTFIAIGVAGLSDAVWLTKSYYAGHINCSVIAGCQDVLKSQYANIHGVPMALLGAIFYAVIIISAAHYLTYKNRFSLRILSILPSIGFLVSLYLIYLQLYVIKAICIYCMLSATTSIILFILSLILIYKTRTKKIERTSLN